MKICFPVTVDAGMDSSIYGHFASAPFFMIIDTNTLHSSTIANCDPIHPFAGCNPFRALSGQHLDGIVVGGIGDASVRVMTICGFKVFEAISLSVADSVELFKSGALPEVAINNSAGEERCSSGESGNACNHANH